ncbi:MAG: RES family NAD+ phosphorylase [Legionellales bacterium]|nr:RES family NAD+ phosphorylase [Legionellales bacterium]
MNELFTHSVRFNQSAKRNVVYVSPPQVGLGHLIDSDDAIEDLILFQTAANKNISQSNTVDNDFYYTAAIDYPFMTEPYLKSRYSDGSYPVWYGAKDIETTVYETAYYAVKYAKHAGITENEGVIIKKRTLFDVHCNAILINLVGHESAFPQLISDDYHYTNFIGKEIKQGGYPGLLSPSARYPSGINVNIFKKEILDSPRLIDVMEYQIDLAKKQLRVVKNRNIFLSISI